ncbi:protein starmaker-like [Arabidopsis lyrata subsp. lyrata]|uniref:protein starmaker-like n=1 Tax=Arabidopsis lyrata subsp. lyrata TaxID=81972 RepID=UPI000A29C7AE|nr:protein starmaker-like [Arabidopsis lyrata subsp. lyrata]|eukprot:XP_020876139.1 protein starmaker-like [Arabidopsis lyrata subsp. lyrata]
MKSNPSKSKSRSPSRKSIPSVPRCPNNVFVPERSKDRSPPSGSTVPIVPVFDPDLLPKRLYATYPGSQKGTDITHVTKSPKGTEKTPVIKNPKGTEKSPVTNSPRGGEESPPSKSHRGGEKSPLSNDGDNNQPNPTSTGSSEIKDNNPKNRDKDKYASPPNFFSTPLEAFADEAEEGDETVQVPIGKDGCGGKEKVDAAPEEEDANQRPDEDDAEETKVTEEGQEPSDETEDEDNNNDNSKSEDEDEESDTASCGGSPEDMAVEDDQVVEDQNDEAVDDYDSGDEVIIL